jgi:hypothetical protein
MPIHFSRPRLIDIFGWVLLAAAMIFAIYVRVRLRDFPLERDEGEFAYAGQLMLQGVPPYKLAYNMKLPGTYIAYAVLMAVFGQSIAGIHLGLLAVNLATILLLYRLTRELFDPVTAGLAAVFISVTSISPGVLGMAAHATHFVALFGVAGAWMLWRYLQSGGWKSLLASGLLLGTAFLMKQQGVFLLVFGGAVVAVNAVVALIKAFRQSESSPRSKLRPILQAGAFCAAAVLPYLLVCLWLWFAGVFDTFKFWTVTYAREYVAEVHLADAWANFWQGEGGHVVLTDRLAWTLALVGAVILVVRGWFRPGRSAFVLGFFICSFLCVCPGFFFRSHYFIAVLPAVAMLGGVACGDFLWLAGLWKVTLVAAPAAIDEPPGRRKKPRAAPQPVRPGVRFAPLLIPAAITVLAAIFWEAYDPIEKRVFLYDWPPKQSCRLLIYTGNPFVEAPEVARYLNEHMSADDTMAILGSEPEIPFYSRRHSATGFIYTYGLMEAQPLAEKMQKDMVGEIEKKKPKYMLVVDCRCSWLYNLKSPLYLHNWANRYLRENYEVVGLVERPPWQPSAPLQPISFRAADKGPSETPIARWLRKPSGEGVLGWLGTIDGYRPNPLEAECIIWICRRK